jgi:hypothetical protein
MRSEQSQVQTENELYDLLASLGDAPDQVALNLKEGGFVGERDSAYCCPVARFLRARAAADGVMVDDELIQVEYLGIPVPTFSTQPPTAVRQFIQQFDAGDWPELVEVMP